MSKDITNEFNDDFSDFSDYTVPFDEPLEYQGADSTDRTAFSMLTERVTDEELLKTQLELFKTKLGVTDDDYIFYIALIIQNTVMASNKKILDDYRQVFVEQTTAAEFKLNNKNQEFLTEVNKISDEMKKVSDTAKESMSQFATNVAANVARDTALSIERGIEKAVVQLDELKKQFESSKQKILDDEKQNILKNKEKYSGAPYFYFVVGIIFGFILKFVF